MASSKPVVRTYIRKRKETAEEKYDAIFAPKTEPVNVISSSKNQSNDLKRRRIQTEIKQNNRLSSKTNLQSKNMETIENNRDTAAEKFDAIFGPESKINGNNNQSPKKFPVATNRSNNGEKCSNAGSCLNSDNCSEKEEKNHTKYDLMFEQNEKRASDKFDALFSESEHVSTPKFNRKVRRIEEQSQTLDILSSFNSWEDEADSTKSRNSSRDTSPQKSLSPTKLPGITHASMVKLGGRLVLNIQRGGNSNSLVDKGGTVLLASKEKLNAQNMGNSMIKEDTVKQTSTLSSPDIVRTAGLDIHETLQAQSSFESFKKKYDEKSKSHVHPPNPIRESSTRNKISNSRSIKILPGTTAISKKKMKSKVSYNSRPWAPKESSSNLSYNPRSWAQPEDVDSQSSVKSFSSESLSSSQHSESLLIDVSKSKTIPVLKKSVTWPKNVGESIVTSLKCDKNHQQYFTVVRHVKHYQNCLEEGEIQEFEDEVLYLQEGLPSHQPISVRCLSVTSLACKCEQQNFRLYLRAHNVLTKIFDMLQDADENRALSLATSSLLYMLSRDRQIDINKETLRILLKLVDPLENKNKTSTNKDTTASPVKTKYSRLHQRSNEVVTVNPDQEVEAVRSKVKDMIDRCGDPLVTSKYLSTKVLASEALLRYTARRTSEWYREEIRLKGGLDHVISLVKAQVDIVDDFPAELDCSSKPLVMERPLCMLERLLRVLENGIVNSPRNAMYLVTHQRALLLKKISLLMKKCENWLRQTEDDHAPDTPPSSAKNNASLIIKNVISQIIKLLVNISNDSEWSSTRIGDQEGMLDIILSCILNIPKNVNEDHRYEIMLLSLGLLVNLVESSAKNRMALMQMTMTTSPVTKQSDGGEIKQEGVVIVEGLVQLFIEREIAAKENEILGEEGVKRAAEAKKKNNKLGSSHSVALGDEDEGYWVESDEGMEWVSVERKNKNVNDDLPSSQGSHRSIGGDPQNIEARLTAEEKDEMKQALEKASDHMEASIIASYTALVLGCLIHGSRANATAIRSRLPDNGELSPMIRMLKKFLSFMNLTHGMSKKGEQKLIQVIEDMEEVNLEVMT